jgi:acetyl/propionyl-CoA carboxylase alpha subunit
MKCISVTVSISIQSCEVEVNAYLLSELKILLKKNIIVHRKLIFCSVILFSHPKTSVSYSSFYFKVTYVTSPLPGIILEVAVKEGVKVKKGQKLIVLEAMKMENVIEAILTEK